MSKGLHFNDKSGGHFNHKGLGSSWWQKGRTNPGKTKSPPKQVLSVKKYVLLIFEWISATSRTFLKRQINMMADENEDENYVYEVGIHAKHPTWDLGQVLQPLGIATATNRVAGSQQIAPDGRLLLDKCSENFWNWRRAVKRERDFFSAVRELTNVLAPHRNLIISVTESGGIVAVSFGLPGYTNIGSGLSFRDMSRLVDLKVDLNIEIRSAVRNFL